MKLTKQQVQKISDLAKLDISNREVDYYAEELSAVLDYVEQLDKVNTEDISPKIQASSLSNATREDSQHPDRKDVVKKLMEMAPFTKSGFVKVKSILNKNK